MTFTIEEAQAKLAQIIAQAEAGEEVVITAPGGLPAVKLVAVAAKGSRLAQHPEIKSALTVLDHEALLKPLPPQEWGELAER